MSAKYNFNYLKVHFDPVPTGPLSNASIGDFRFTDVFVRCMNLLLIVY